MKRLRHLICRWCGQSMNPNYVNCPLCGGPV